MKSLISIFLITLLTLSGAVVADDLPCDKGIYRGLCNPNLKIVKSCYDCNRLDKDKERCFPSFNKFDITDFLSSKKWSCHEHEWVNAKDN
jgi:hypothetical protein